MFGLIYNLYKFCKKKAERKITIALLGLDNAGKTTLLNALKGEVEADTTPTFGFNTSTLQDGKYTIEVFDLGGGKSIRSVWSRYLAEVHGIVYVVDAADAQRFEESKKVLAEVLENQYMRDKPIAVFANKQDLPTASSPAEVVKGLGMAACRNTHNVVPCTAKSNAGEPVDPRLREGLRWLIGYVDREYSRLDPRVKTEAEEVRVEEALKKKEREERLKRQREERLRQQEEEAARAREVEKDNELHDGMAPSLAAAAAAGLQVQVLSPDPPTPQELRPRSTEPDPTDRGLCLVDPQPTPPNTIESPASKFPPPRRPASRDVGHASDLRPAVADQGTAASPAPPPPLGPLKALSNGQLVVPAALPGRAALPPLAPLAPSPLPPLQPPMDGHGSYGPGPGAGLAARPPSRPPSAQRIRGGEGGDEERAGASTSGGQGPAAAASPSRNWSAGSRNSTANGFVGGGVGGGMGSAGGVAESVVGHGDSSGGAEEQASASHAVRARLAASSGGGSSFADGVHRSNLSLGQHNRVAPEPAELPGTHAAQS
ncbi:hypothetical protein HYH03_004920 [Edaphochlamys debaryana]|uniref:ADP-ribosylation factor-like protein 13B n=1 Tax=Edaphochlamys debaryana TaxID=47281 RepID=A0A836C2R9_9CHLO|nr:hypothetical protein HYH03_004920 [Edaphochlamys debaryana]|eukprot:KAG2496914.1 hypothetical protein HYH03_004920 [Edaphochlamys debaryana]